MIGVAQWVWPPGGQPHGEAVLRARQDLDLGPTVITYHQLITIGVAILVAIGLRLLLYRTRIGRGHAGGRRRSGAGPAQRRPDRRRGSQPAGRSARRSPPSAASSSCRRPASARPTLSLLIVNAYAAAVFGRLRSLPMTFVGAIILGCMDGYLIGYLPVEPVPAGPAAGRSGDPAVRRAAGHAQQAACAATSAPVSTSRRRPARAWSCSPVLRFAFGVVLATTLSRPDLSTYAKIFVVGIVALSLVPLVGFAGQISLCQLSFAGIGAVVMAHLGAGGNPMGAACGRWSSARLVGALVALPALRLSGIYLALATAAFAVVLDRWIFNLPELQLGPIAHRACSSRARWR